MISRPILITAIALALANPAWAAGNSADHDGDGKISGEEFRNQAARAAFDADKNENGVIEDSEFKLTDAQVQAMDTNGDGAVNVEEFQTGQMQGFLALDKNGDGLLDSNELKAQR